MKNAILGLIMTLVINNANSQVKNKNDLKEMEVKGSVKSIRQTSYKAILVSGEVRKGKRKTENKDDKDSYIVFNDKGNRDEETLFKTDGTIYRKETFKYNDHGTVVEAVSYKADGSVTIKGKYTCTYDDKGNLIEKIYDNSDGTIENKYTYKYDDEGNLLERICNKVDGSLRDKYTCKYDSKGNRIEYNTYKANGSLDWKDTYTYDTRGNMLEDNTYKGDGSLEWKITYRYDDNSNCIEENTYKGEKFIIKYVRKFDEKGNQIEIDWCKENGKPYVIYYQKYAYDKNGNWLMQTQFLKDKPTYIYEREFGYF